MVEFVGQVLLNRYKIVEFLRRGGMAEVYLAHDGLRTVARASLKPDTSLDTVGFRCVIEDQ